MAPVDARILRGGARAPWVARRGAQRAREKKPWREAEQEGPPPPGNRPPSRASCSLSPGRARRRRATGRIRGYARRAASVQWHGPDSRCDREDARPALRRPRPASRRGVPQTARDNGERRTSRRSLPRRDRAWRARDRRPAPHSAARSPPRTPPCGGLPPLPGFARARDLGEELLGFDRELANRRGPFFTLFVLEVDLARVAFEGRDQSGCARIAHIDEDFDRRRDGLRVFMRQETPEELSNAGLADAGEEVRELEQSGVARRKPVERALDPESHLLETVESQVLECLACGMARFGLLAAENVDEEIDSARPF